jgi:hypothetical protein
MIKDPHSELANSYRRNWSINDIIAMRQVAEISTLSSERLKATIDAMNHVFQHNITGDIVECGVYRGGTIALCIYMLLKNNVMDKKFWAYDTFDGILKHELTTMDREIKSNDSGYGDSLEKWFDDNGKWCDCEYTQVNINVINHLSALLDITLDKASDWVNFLVRYVKGSVIETIPREIPEKISFIRLDMDISAPTHHTLPYVWDKLSIGGVLHIDDYNMFSGVNEVAKEFFESKFVYMHEIDYTAVAIVKMEK